MTTPSGLLAWGQAGNYNAVNDRIVIRALAGGAVFGLQSPPTLAAGSGLTVNIGAWTAIVDCGDGTSAVIGSTAAATIQQTAGGASQRTDVLWADINVDGTTQWSLSWLPSPVTGRTGVALGTAVVPASAATAAAMTFTPGVATASPPGPPYWPCDTTSRPVTSTSYSQFTGSFLIPAGKITQAGARFLLSAWGTATWGSTTPTFQMRGNSPTAGLSGLLPTVPIGYTAFTSGQVPHWLWRLHLMFTQAGNNAGWQAIGELIIALGTGNLLPASSTQQMGAACRMSSAASGVDLTKDVSLYGDFAWGGAGSTLNCSGSLLQWLNPPPGVTVP